MYTLHLSDSLISAQQDDFIREMTVGDLLREVAVERASATALLEVDMEGQTGRSWTYSELLSDSEKLALSLTSRYSQGERITVWAPNVPEWLLIEYACALAGLVLVTANPSYQDKELRYVLEQSGSVALFLVKHYRGNPMHEIALKAIEGLSAVREIVDMDDHAALFRKGDRVSMLPEVHPTDPAQI